MASSLSASQRNGSREHAEVETNYSDNAPDSSANHGSLTYSGSKGTGPSLLHRIQNSKSILALAVSNSNIYAGTQGGEILVIDISDAGDSQLLY